MNINELPVQSRFASAAPVVYASIIHTCIHAYFKTIATVYNHYKMSHMSPKLVNR